METGILHFELNAELGYVNKWMYFYQQQVLNLIIYTFQS